MKKYCSDVLHESIKYSYVLLFVSIFMKFVHLKSVLLLADLVDFLFQITLVVMLDEVIDSVLSREKKEILLQSLKKTRPVKSRPGMYT